MKDFLQETEWYYETLVVPNFNGLNPHIDNWLSNGYNRLEIDADSYKVSVSIQGSDFIKLDSPDKVIQLFHLGKEMILYPIFGDRDPTSAAIHTEHVLLRPFPRSFVEELRTRGFANYGTTEWFLYPEALCMRDLSMRGRPKFWVTNVYYITRGPDTVDEDLKEHISTIKSLIKICPRYISRGVEARKVFLTMCPEFQYNAKDVTPKEFLIPFFQNMKGQMFKVLGVGMTGTQEYGDFEALYLNIAKRKLMPMIDGVTGYFIRSKHLQDDAHAGRIDITGTAPQIGDTGIIPVKQCVGYAPNRDFVGEREPETRLSYPIGPLDGPVSVGLEEIKRYQDLGLMGNQLKIVDSWQFIPTVRPPLPNVVTWADKIGEIAKKDKKYKYLYQFALTGGSFPTFEKFEKMPDGIPLTIPLLVQTGNQTVPSWNPHTLFDIFSTSRALLVDYHLLTLSKTMIADGGDKHSLAPTSIKGYPVKYFKSNTPGFVFDVMRRDENNGHWQERVQQVKDWDHLPLHLETRISLQEARWPIEIGRKKGRDYKLTPHAGDEDLPPIEQIGTLFDSFIKAKPHPTTTPYKYSQLRRLQK